jgi:hypothetical protein
MNKLITTLAAIFIATSAHAEITIVNPGSEEGAFRQVLTTIGQEVEHDFVQANNPVTAYSYIDGASTPVLTVWSSEWPGDADMQSPAIGADNLVALMTYETMMCSRQFANLDAMAGQDVKIATWGSEPVAKFLTVLGIEKDINFVVVPFGGSGSTTKGYIAGDADTVFTITTRQSAIEEDSATSCIAFSADGELGFRFVDAIATVGADTATTDGLRTLVGTLSNTAEWNDKFGGTVTYVGGTGANVFMFEEAVVNFSK